MLLIPPGNGSNSGKFWRNQKLVANQDNKKYIALDTPVSVTDRKSVV